MPKFSRKAVLAYLEKHSYEQTSERFDLSVGKVFSIEAEAERTQRQ